MVVVRVVFGDESDSRRLALKSGFPETVKEMCTIMKTYFKLSDDFRLQFMDPLFKEFMNLESISDITDLELVTLKIIITPAYVAPHPETLNTIHLPPAETSTTTYLQLEETSTALRSAHVTLHPVDSPGTTPDTDSTPDLSSSSTYTGHPGHGPDSYSPPPDLTSPSTYTGHPGHCPDSYSPPSDLTSPSSYTGHPGHCPDSYSPPSDLTSPSSYTGHPGHGPDTYSTPRRTAPSTYTGHPGHGPDSYSPPPDLTSPSSYTGHPGHGPDTYSTPRRTAPSTYTGRPGTVPDTYSTPNWTAPSCHIPPVETPYISNGQSSSPAPLSACSSNSGPLSLDGMSSEVFPWPKVFTIPKFSYDAEFELEKKNAEFQANGTYFTPGLKLKGVILEALAQEIMKYTKYPKPYMWEQIAGALIRAHPCLAQLGAKEGFGGWVQSLKTKMQNYRTKLGRLGHPEIIVNSLKHKREGKNKPAANIKKPKKAEVNYIPLPPKGATPESMEKERIALLSEVKKRDNEVVIRAKMGLTFSHRRLEVVDERPFVGDFMERWPALFQPSEINAEFMRVTTKPLQSSFMGQWDHLSGKLIQIIQTKRGQAGKKIKEILLGVDSCDIFGRRERVLKSLVFYLGERADVLFKEFQDFDALEKARAEREDTEPMWLYRVGKKADGQAQDIGILIEKVTVLNNLDNMTLGFVMLSGIIYALDLKYPDHFQNTFDFIQKVVMALDPESPKKKVQLLQIKLCE